jgi:hypothetical protein
LGDKLLPQLLVFLGEKSGVAIGRAPGLDNIHRHVDGNAQTQKSNGA